jgi:voltage-gated potassium channel
MPSGLKKFLVPILLLFLLYIIAIYAYHALEGWDWLKAAYFATTTLTTVGYGDVYPTNDASRLFTIFYIWSGISVAFMMIYTAIDYYREVTTNTLERYRTRIRRHL